VSWGLRREKLITKYHPGKYMNNSLRIAVAIPALTFILVGVLWLLDPARVAGELGMPLLDGLGRSTQIGDLAAFFFGGGLMVLIGLKTGNATWLHAPALLLGLTAIFRTVAWAIQGAPFATEQIVVELVVTALLVFAASKMD
jgi:hypothetical protein